MNLRSTEDDLDPALITNIADAHLRWFGMIRRWTRSQVERRTISPAPGATTVFCPRCETPVALIARWHPVPGGAHEVVRLVCHGCRIELSIVLRAEED